MSELRTVYRLQQPRPSPVMGPYQEIIDRWLLKDQQRPRKQRHTARRICERLKDERQFTGKETIVWRFVRLRKAVPRLKRPDCRGLRRRFPHKNRDQEYEVEEKLWIIEHPNFKRFWEAEKIRHGYDFHIDSGRPEKPQDSQC